LHNVLLQLANKNGIQNKKKSLYGSRNKFQAAPSPHTATRDIWQMSVVMQRLVDFISIVTNSTLLRNNTGDNSTLLRNNETAISIGSAITLQLEAVTEEE
jgi:hypothetical protein